ncbi:MAG: methyltransferase domain-containing protein [Deltaproteobacteria bacterium]|nr:methyltransferase domain-containing protein [Deltaproteobacteria bacterium]
MNYERILNNLEDLEEAKRLLQPDESDLMLDLACGIGETTVFFAPHVKSVIAADMSMETLKKAQAVISEQKELANVAYREADVEDLPFPAGAFSLLCRRGDFHHFTDLSRAFEEFFRVLRWQGRLCVIDSLMPEDPEAAAFAEHLHQLRDPAHTRAYSREEWLAAAAETDFIVNSVQIFGKQRDFKKWCRAADLSPAICRKIEKVFLDADTRIKDFFQVEVFAGEVEGFVEPAILIFATHPAKPVR